MLKAEILSHKQIGQMCFNGCRLTIDVVTYEDEPGMYK